MTRNSSRRFGELGHYHAKLSQRSFAESGMTGARNPPHSAVLNRLENDCVSCGKRNARNPGNTDTIQALTMRNAEADMHTPYHLSVLL